jgi:ABC-type Fe3+/spermidine/putrescine transport system ATPase subunit
LTLPASYLSIDRLTVGYGATPVLVDVSLCVAKGELLALLGSSGCGKSTLLRAIAGLTPPSSGTITIAGRDVTRLPPEAHNTAMVFQSYALWPHMTVNQNIGYGLKLRGWPRDRIEARVADMLKLLHLEGFGGRRATDLSGGQRQRVALGRALAIEPDVLLLDEPMSNLDAQIRLELRHELRALQQRIGITAVYVTHDREEALALADHMAVLDAGNVMQYGTPEELYSEPGSPFVARFMGADNAIELEVASGGLTVVGDDAAFRAPVPETIAATRGRAIAHFRSDAARIDLGTPAHGTAALPGTISSRSYLGNRWRYAVRTGAQQIWVDDPSRHEVGAAVHVIVPAHAWHVYPKTETQPRGEAA